MGTNRVYVATDGSYGDAAGMAIISTEGWTGDDWEELDNASDSDRRDTALRISGRVSLAAHDEEVSK
jgi:hypothetical protein